MFAERDGFTYPLPSDPDKPVAKAWGAFGEKTMYGKPVTCIVRPTFVVDETGAVTVARCTVEATGHVTRLTRLLGVSGK